MNTNRIRHAIRAAFETLDPRQLLSATSVKANDSAGPDYAIVESNGHMIEITSTASGAGPNLIVRTDGSVKSSVTLVDLSKSGATLQSLDDLTVAGDGTVYFTATNASGRQVFKLNGDKGGYSAVTSKANASFDQLIAVGTKLYAYDRQNAEIDAIDSKGKLIKLGEGTVAKMFRARDQLFYVLASDGGLWRSDGTASGTFKVSQDLQFGAAKVFGTQDFVYFEGDRNNTTNLYRTDGSSATPTVVATDFSILTNVVAEIGGDVYFSGSYYNSAGGKAAGNQLYRIGGADAEVEQVTSLSTAEGGAHIDGIAAIGDSVYFNAGDGTFLSTQGTADRELYRFDAVTRAVKLITSGNDLYPVDDINGGVLGSYYFVAAPTKDDARFGSRRLYRTNPSDDRVEEVGGLPSYTDSNGTTRQDVSLVFGSSKGLFYSARNADGTGGDYDTYYVSTPFTLVDPATHALDVLGTDSNDTMTLRTDGNDLVFTLNGVEERRAIGTFGDVNITMKNGDDRFTADANVTVALKITGDSGNDTLRGGSGNDNLLGGAGKNQLFGGAGNDRLRGGGGKDDCYGEAGNDRLYGYGGSDLLSGGEGVDYLYGDDATGAQGDDTLIGGSGNDYLYGRGGNDLLVGGKQNDQLRGGDGDDTLQGLDGNDLFEGGAGADLINGGTGTDSLLDRDDDDVISLVES